MSAKTETRLAKIGHADYKVAKGDHDVRGWDVLGADGSKIGKVTDLIFDKQTERVRYLELLVNANYPEVEDKKVLVPVGLASLHPDNKLVTLRDIDEPKLRHYPVYSGSDITRDYEYSLRDYLTKSVSQEEIQTDRLSPAREKTIREEERERTEAETDHLVKRLQAERDEAYRERDRAIEERNILRKELDELRHSNQVDDNFYRHPFFDRDRPDKRV